MNKLKNWNYKTMTDFLRYFGFSFSQSLNGSHVIWKNKEGVPVELCYYNKKKAYRTNSLVATFKKLNIPLWVAKKWTTFSKKDKEFYGQIFSNQE